MDDAADSAAYDFIASRWLEPAVHPALVRAVGRIAPSVPWNRLLDAGSGSGRLALALARAYPAASIHGVDLSSAMLRLARANAEAAGVAPRLSFTRTDLARSAFSGNAFDGAFSYGSLHHWRDPAAVFSELARLVRPGGLILVGDWRRDPAPLDFFRSGRGSREWSLIEASLHAAYREDEVQALLSPLENLARWEVERHAIGLLVRGWVLPGEPAGGSPVTSSENRDA